MGGKLKITGDIMASQKLDFLKKMDPKQAMEAVQRKRGQPSAVSSQQSAAAAPAKTEAKAPAIFKALADRLSKNAGLAKEVGAVIQVNVTNPDGHWTIDLTGNGAVKEGTDPKAATTLRIDDADLVALTKDPSRARDYFQRGKLRVDGDVRFAQKLSFLKDLT
jgi:3-hydroxyacyl-CoA dehydrogenase/3a,7a,12a-trihydroxy-5b-cholest-24-enoyl-CoA hydratase